MRSLSADRPGDKPGPPDSPPHGPPPLDLKAWPADRQGARPQAEPAPTPDDRPEPEDLDADPTIILFAQLVEARGLRDRDRVSRLQERLRRSGWAVWPIAIVAGKAVRS